MTISTNLVSGLSSSIDWATMVDQLISIDHKRVDLVSSQKSEYEAKLKEWQSFNTKLLALKTAAEGIKDLEDFSVYKASMTTNSATVKGSDLMSVTTSSTASIGSYQIIVNTLAVAEKVRSGSYTDISTALGAGYAGDILINGETVSIDATDTLASLQNKINNANTGTSPTGVTASIVKYGENDYRMTLTSDETGAAGIDLQNGSVPDILSLFNFTEVVNGADASFTVDGLAITQASNTVDDVIAGVTIDLLKADPDTTVTLAINRDIDAVKGKIQTFVSKYNDVASYINTQSSYDTEANKAGGILFGDGTLSSVKSDLTSLITQSVWGVSSQFSIMGLVGINLDNKGQLSVNDTTLTGYLKTNFNDVAALFVGQGVTSNGSLEYVAHTQNSKAGEYTVNITTAGQNIAGTINGEPATGSGQVLTGNAGNANTEGLSVKYTGTAMGDIGTIKLTTGVADLFSRILFNITDSYEGYVTFKETSLQSSIDGFKTKIEQMEAQLERKKEMMINRFVAMEIALDTMKNQSNWLAGQLTSAASAWSWA